MKIVVLGAAGGIGQALSLLLKLSLPSGSTLALYDINPLMTGIAVDLSHIPTAIKVEGFSEINNIENALQGSDIVLIAAGIARKPGMKRADLLNINATIVYELIEKIAEICAQACIGIITNPVNTTVVIAAEALKKRGVYNRKKLFGITTLDVIRTNTFVANLKNLSPQSLEIPVIGGHSSTTILPLLSTLSNVNFSHEEIFLLTERIRNAGTEVVTAKAGHGSATLSMGQAAARFGLSLALALQGKPNIIECAYVDSELKYAPFFAQPVLLDKNGIAAYQDISALSDYETHQLAALVGNLNDDIKLGKEFMALL